MNNPAKHVLRVLYPFEGFDMCKRADGNNQSETYESGDLIIAQFQGIEEQLIDAGFVQVAYPIETNRPTPNKHVHGGGIRQLYNNN